MLADRGSMGPGASVLRALEFSLGIFTLTALIGVGALLGILTFSMRLGARRRALPGPASA